MGLAIPLNFILAQMLLQNQVSINKHRFIRVSFYTVTRTNILRVSLGGAFTPPLKCSSDTLLQAAML